MTGLPIIIVSTIMKHSNHPTTHLLIPLVIMSMFEGIYIQVAVSDGC